ncbi:MAG: iron-containing alcohol dehydrogenase [Clostridia bacterium]|nr:iron-containing alcohol dehydrogenase [Clostridia bacterium]
MEKFNPVEKIIFKQNVFGDLSEYLKKYKKVLIVTSLTPKTLYLNTLCNFLNENQVCFEVFLLKETSCNQKNLLLLASRSLGADCLVAFGLGSVCDLTKLAAKKQNIPYIVCPTAIANFAALSNICYFKNELKINKIECNFPEKVFVDEGLIAKSPERFITSTFSFIFSFYETYFCEYVNNLLFSNLNFEFLNKLKEILQKTEGLINYVEINKKTVTLNLMDNIIELFTLVYQKNLPFSALNLAAENHTNKKNFGQNCLLSASVLMQVYKNFWSSNLAYQDIPNIQMCLNLLANKGENEQFFFNFCENNKIFTNERFIFKAKSIKQNVLEVLEKTITKISKLSKKLSNLNSTETKCVSAKEIFDGLIYDALKSNNKQLNAILRLGYLNLIV